MDVNFATEWCWNCGRQGFPRTNCGSEQSYSRLSANNVDLASSRQSIVHEYQLRLRLTR